MAIRVCWGHMEPPYWGRGGRRGSAMAPLERAMVVSYRLSIVTIALSVTIRPQLAIECLRRSNQQGVGHFGPKFRGGADPSCWGCKERTSVILFSKNSNQCDHNPPTSQTDDMRWHTALCTSVHRAVKISSIHRNEHKNINEVNRWLKQEVNDTVKASEW